jgi:hypothetical protein
MKGLRVIAGVRVHALEDAQLVHVPRGVGQQLGHPLTALAVTGEFEAGAGVRLLPGLRLVIEGVHLRGPAAHAEEDDTLGAGREGRDPGGGLGRLPRQPLQREITEAAGGGSQQITSCHFNHHLPLSQST